VRRLQDFIFEEITRSRDLLSEAVKKYDPEKAKKAPSMKSLFKGGQNTSDQDLKELYKKYKQVPPDKLLTAVMGQSTLSDVAKGAKGNYTDPRWAEVVHTAFTKMSSLSNDHFSKLLAGPPEYVIGGNNKPGVFIPMNPEWRTGVVGKESASMKLCGYWCLDLVRAMFAQGFFGSQSPAAAKEIMGTRSQRGLSFGRSPAKDGIYIFKGQFGSFGESGD